MLLINRFPGSSKADYHTAHLDATLTSGQPFEESEIKARLNLLNYRITYGADILRTIHCKYQQGVSITMATRAGS